MPRSLIVNPQVVSAKYAVRGILPQRADAIQREIEEHPGSHPFPSVTYLNIGNPQQLDQEPLTFVRQVLALVQYPALIESKSPLFPKDTLERAKTLIGHIGSVGAYSHSKGVLGIRNEVAKFISKRDGYDSDPENVFLSNGASRAAEKILNLIAADNKVGMLAPIPQYPLYSATSSLVGANFVGYELNEEEGWSTGVDSIRNAYDSAEEQGIEPRLLIVINPGNPTGGVLNHEQIVEILEVARDRHLTVIADEVYQSNILDAEATRFTSFKKVLSELTEKDQSFHTVGLVSLHSTSKGFFGECGQRGGYMEVVNFDQNAMDELYKLSSIELCPVVTGQIVTEMMVNPPKPGDESYELYMKESSSILNTLKERALSLYHAFREMNGVECQRPLGAMYLFPKITLPERAIEAAKEAGMAPDAFYGMALLNETGICVVPGSGFGQKEGTFHFRTTFLAPGGKDLSDRFVNFHNKFMDKYT